MVSLVKPQFFLIVWRPQKIEHRLDRRFIWMDRVVFSVQHQSWNTNARDVVNLRYLGSQFVAVKSACHQHAGLHPILYRWNDAASLATGTHSVISNLFAINIGPCFQIINAPSKILDFLNQELDELI